MTLSSVSHSDFMCLLIYLLLPFLFFFFFNDTATTEIYTLSLHDALPIYPAAHTPPPADAAHPARRARRRVPAPQRGPGDRKSTRLNSSHDQISYAVFCLKKKKTKPLVHRGMQP